MSDNSITIKKLLDLDESIFTKMSDITLEASITLALKPKNVKGSKGDRKWDFWSQFSVINDGTADIGCDLKTDKAENAFTKGMKIKIEKAETDIYKDKNGKMQRKLTKGKVTCLNGQRVSSGGTATPANGYYIVVGPNGKIVLNPQVDKQKRLQLLREGIAKSFIEATQKWNKTIEKQAQESFAWVAGKDKPKEEPKPEPTPIDHMESTKNLTDQFHKLNDPNFNRDKLIGRLGKRFGELFVAGKTKGLNLEEWLSKNYEVKSFMGLSDDYLVEIDSVLDDMEAKG